MYSTTKTIMQCFFLVWNPQLTSIFYSTIVLYIACRIMCWFGDELELFVGVPFLLGHRLIKNVLKLDSEIVTVVITISVEDWLNIEYI